jgi:HSP20 family molecular chaperone IbpA
MGQKDISLSGSHEAAEREQTPAYTLRPAVDIYETDEGLTLVADLPGVTKKELHIDIDQGLLTIKTDAYQPLAGDSLRREFIHGKFFRQFQIPEEVDEAKFLAEMENGVLTLQMPKSETARPRRIEIH